MCRFLISLGDKMRKCHGALGEEHARIEGIETHGLVEAFDRSIGITSIAADPATSLPAGSEIQVKFKRAADQQERTIYFLEEEGSDMPGPTQRHGIIASYFYRTFRQTRYL